jgi:hypothetical protein
MISIFSSEVDETYVLVGYYVVCSGNSLPTFLDNGSVPFSGVRNPRIQEPPRYA